MELNKEDNYITQVQHAEIIQRINDLYSDEYLTGQEYTQLYEQMLTDYIHDELDELYIYNNIFND